MRGIKSFMIKHLLTIKSKLVQTYHSNDRLYKTPSSLRAALTPLAASWVVFHFQETSRRLCAPLVSHTRETAVCGRRAEDSVSLKACTVHV